MAKKKITPEEQLLELVSKNDPQQSFQLGKKKRRELGKDFSVFFASCFKSIISLIRGIRIKSNLKNLNKALLVLCMSLFVYSLSGFIFQDASIQRLYTQASSKKYSISTEEAEQTPKAFLYYLEMVQRRNVFNPIELAREILEEKVVIKKDVSQIIKKFILVGISWSNEPVAMIEDQEKHKTYFLKKGDIIRDMEVKEILDDRVILFYEGSDLELL